MQLHEIKPVHKGKNPKRIGRGGKRGTYSGRGQKGQKSRAGRKMKPAIREFMKRYPKLRGYKQKLRRPKAKKQMPNVVILNLGILEKSFNSGEKITPKALLEKGIISTIKGKMPKVKILGGGAFTKFLEVEGCIISNQAKEKMAKAGKESK